MTSRWRRGLRPVHGPLLPSPRGAARRLAGGLPGSARSTWGAAGRPDRRARRAPRCDGCRRRPVGPVRGACRQLPGCRRAGRALQACRSTTTRSTSRPRAWWFTSWRTLWRVSGDRRVTHPAAGWARRVGPRRPGHAHVAVIGEVLATLVPAEDTDEGSRSGRRRPRGVLDAAGLSDVEVVEMAVTVTHPTSRSGGSRSSTASAPSADHRGLEPGVRPPSRRRCAPAWARGPSRSRGSPSPGAGGHEASQSAGGAGAGAPRRG